MRNRRSFGQRLWASGVLLVLMTVCGVASAQENALRNKAPKIGLVLSGGGARGSAHVGVIKVLEELRIPIHAIASNSMGALVGGAYAYGLSPSDMEATLTSVDWTQALSDRPHRTDLAFRRKQDSLNFLVDLTFGFRDFRFVLPKGLVQGHYTSNILKFMALDAHHVRHFDDLPIPFRAVATEIGTGDEVVLESGSLPLAMTASMAIPGFFSPVSIDGRELVDGMVVNNIPIDVGKAMGVDVVIAVDIGTPLLKPEEITDLLAVTGQMVSILMQRTIDERRALLTDEDVLIEPDLGDISSTSFDRVAEGIEIGEKAARAMADTLRQFSVSEAEYQEFLKSQRRPATPMPILERVVLDNQSRLDDRAFTSRMRLRAGDRFDPEVLEADIESIFGLDDFERVTFDLHRTDSGRAVLTLVIVPKSWGPSYLRFGLNLEDDLDGEATYNFRVNYTARNLNSLGGEWRNDAQVGRQIRFASEFFQPVAAASPFFIAPAIEYNEIRINEFANGQRVGVFDVGFSQVGIDAGMLLGNWGEIRVGLQRSRGDISADVTSTPLSVGSFDDAGIRVLLNVDMLDSPNFPQFGGAGSVEYFASSTELGADDDYQRFALTGAYAHTFGRQTVIPVISWGTRFESVLPSYRLHRTGGFLNLSGLAREEIAGQHALLMQLITYRLVGGRRGESFGMPIYIGGSLEAGSVTDDRDRIGDDLIMAGSGFIGIDSPVGPIYLGYGAAEGGRNSVYLFVGRPF